MNNDFFAIKTEGALLTRGLLNRLSKEDADLPGVAPQSFHFAKQNELNEDISNAWNRAQGLWLTFKDLRDNLPDSDIGTTITRERWMLRLFNFLGYGRLNRAHKIEIDERPYPVSHLYNNFPIHIRVKVHAACARRYIAWQRKIFSAFLPLYPNLYSLHLVFPPLVSCLNLSCPANRSQQLLLLPPGPPLPLARHP